MQQTSKKYNYYKILDEISLQDEEGYVENIKNKLHEEIKKQNKNPIKNQKNKKNSVWFTAIERYLRSIEYAFDKGNLTSQKVSLAFDKIPEPTSKKFVLRFTIVFFIIVLLVFFTSCKAYSQTSTLQNTNNNTSNKTDNLKNQEQLFIKRENLQIKNKEAGSSSGSIWADSTQPKGLVTDYQPTHIGDVLTVTIPEDLQFTPPADQANAANAQKFDPVKSLKFEVIGIEPGGDVFLRATKNYVSETGENRSILVMAKMPQRNLNKFEISANELTQVAVNTNINGATSDYSYSGWDKIVSRKVSGFAPDLNSMATALEGKTKELETQQKALKDQQKSLQDEADRVKKDRERLNSETAKAKQLLDSATIVDAPSDGGKGGNNKSQNNNQSGSNNK